MSLSATLRRLDTDLRHAQVGWALVGGLAVSVRTEPRFTRDVDVAVAVEGDAGAESLARSMMSSGYRMLATIEQDETGRLATIRLVPPLRDIRSIVVDLLFASSGIESELVASAELRQIDTGLVVPVARTGHLIAMKLLARDDETRPLDGRPARAARSRGRFGASPGPRGCGADHRAATTAAVTCAVRLWPFWNHRVDLPRHRASWPTRSTRRESTDERRPGHPGLRPMGQPGTSAKPSVAAAVRRPCTPDIRAASSSTVAASRTAAKRGGSSSVPK